MLFCDYYCPIYVQRSNVDMDSQIFSVDLDKKFVDNNIFGF